MLEDSGATTINVRANDTNAGAATISGTTPPANGTVVVTNAGADLTYAPNANYCNSPGGSPDTFTYTLTPGGSTATVSMTVTCVDDPPVAVNDSATVAEDSGATTVNVLANDTDIDGGPKSIASVTQPTNGAVVITNAGADLTYAPNANYCNSPGGSPDTFNYTLTPGGSTATVSMTVTCVDDPPVAVDDAATVLEDAAATAVDVLANDTDVDGGPKSIASVTQPTNGAVVITGGGTGLTYKPNADYCNDGTPTDNFTYTLTPAGATPTATVRMTVTCVNDAPVANDDSYNASEDTTLNVDAIDGVLTNDTDVEGDALTAVLAVNVSNGTLTLNPDGSFTYEPDLNFCGEDSFTYFAYDGDLYSSSAATATITVLCINDAPVMVSVSAGSQTSDYSDYIGTVTITATDVDSTSLTLSQSGAPSTLPDPSLNSTTDCDIVPNASSADGSSCTWTMDGQVLTAGTNVHNIDFTAKDDLALSSVCSGVDGTCRHVLTVQPEDADVVLDEDNPVAIQVALAGGTSGEFKLHFAAWETTDPEDFAHGGTAEFGDLSKMTPKMKLNPVGPGGSVPGACVPLAPLPVYPGEGYSQVALFECTFNGVPVNVYEVVATVDNGATASYYQGSDESMLTVFDPSLGFTTGGGWFYWPGTEITDENHPCYPYAGDKTNFGWNMKYNKKFTNLQGSLLVMRHTLNEFCEDDQYRVKSNALNILTLGDVADANGPYGWTLFSGKASYREPGADNAGNHSFVVYAEDHGKQGCNQSPTDEFWLQVKNQDGVIVLQIPGSTPAMPNPAVDGDDVPINCGNIYVPHKNGPK